MQIKCGKCGRMMNLPPSSVGKKIRCSCGEMLTVPAPGASSAGAAPQIKVSSSPRRPVESYWWLMAYITINRILGYIFIALLALGAVLGGFAFISQIYQLSDLPVNQYLPALLTLLLMGIGYLLTAFVYVVIWFASADFLRAVVEIAENTRRIK